MLVGVSVTVGMRVWFEVGVSVTDVTGVCDGVGEKEPAGVCVGV